MRDHIGLRAPADPLERPAIARRRAALAWLAACVAAPIAGFPTTSAAQPHVVRRGAYTLRASVIRVRELPAATREAHDLPASPDASLLNVSIERRRGEDVTTVPADVEVGARDLGGVPLSVRVREVRENGYVSYLGVFDAAGGAVVDLRVRARPQDESFELVETFRERVVP